MSETLRLPQNPSPAPSPGQPPETLLAELLDTIENQPRANWRETVRIDHLETPESAWRAIALSAAYLAEGGDALAFFDALGALVARDDFTELHAIKHHQTLLDEYHATRPDFRNAHAIAAAKSAAIALSGKEQTVYEKLEKVLGRA